MLIIPAIDIINNSVVRLSKGKYDNITDYKESPFDRAVIFAEHNFEWIHIIDLMGSKEGSINIGEIITEIKKQTKLKIEFGGGIRSSEDVLNVIDYGIDKVIIGSLAINNKKEFEKAIVKTGPNKIIIAADVLHENIQVKGWTENSGIRLNDHIKYCFELGITNFLITDIDKDGLLEGPNTSLYQKCISTFPQINIIASGGVSSLKDLNNLNEINCYAAVVGRAIYENKIDLKELARFGN